MNSDAVIGCDAVEAGSEWLRLKTASGAVRTIPWSAIRLAGMNEKLEGHITIERVTEKVAPFRATHDSLWIAYADDSFAQVMIEKTSPKRDALLKAFAEHLGDRWRPNDLAISDWMGQMMIPHKVRMSKAVILMLAVTAIIFFVSIAILFFVHGAKPTSP